jgi:hypothetical protein
MPIWETSQKAHHLIELTTMGLMPRGIVDGQHQKIKAVIDATTN